MGISFVEFRVAMETYGAKKLPDGIGSRYAVPVPCFSVGETIFLHSGSYYIVQRGTEASREIMNRAMAEFGEKDPGGDNYWYGEIHSIKGILTLAAMLENKYSKEWINELTNATYKKLLECSLITKSEYSPRTKKLLKKIAEFDSLVNPFSNNELVLKDPIEYLDRLKLSIRYKEDDEEPFARFYLEEESIEIKYDNDPDGWTYNTLMYVQRNGLNGCINLIHYYEKGDKSKPADEVIYLDYDANRKSYDDHPDDIDLRISLKTGLAWKTYHEEEAAPVTDEQVKLMLTHLNMCIKRIKSSIIRYMIRES
jgi:hypothetical protein